VSRTRPASETAGDPDVVVPLSAETTPVPDLDHARLAAIVEYSHDAIISTAIDGKITTWNPAAERMFGYLSPDAIGKSVGMLVRRDHPEERARILATIKSGSRVDRYETEWVGNDWRRVDVSVSVSPIRDAIGSTIGAAIVARDIADWKWLQSQYRQAQKLEALGRLASGVAHDFNNLVTVISGFSELLLMQLAPTDSRRSLVEEIARAGERASALTRQLLVFSRQQVVTPRELNLNDIVAEVEKMLRRLIGENIEFTTVLDPGLEQVESDAGQIEQVIVNLVVNARDAMPDGGKLRIETANVQLDSAHARAHPMARTGQHVVLVVSDTGIGMDAQTRSQVFEPFFTTKPLDKGTGLGLSTVHGIVKQWGGHITVDSELGQGTTFRVYFPRMDSTSSSSAGVESPTMALGGSETVLLVEDDVVVRSLVSQVLTGQGYGVLETANGDEAQRVAREFGKPIQLLVTDVILPGLSGRAVAERLRELQPAMKVLYLSGYGESTIGRQGVLPADAPFLPKPFLPSVLVRTVREVLDTGKKRQ
jgi:PAS domain S-box-containing protein